MFVWNTALVLGMHRSGTSAVASAINGLGLSTGVQGRQLGAALENPLGFSELRSVMEFNDRLLARLGWSWDFVPLTPAALTWMPSDADAARSVLDSEPERPRCLKDPRMAVLLPVWRAALLDRCSAVVALRDPREVTWSLVVRNGFTPAHAASLWISYNFHLAEAVSGLDVRVQSFDDLTTQPADSILSLAQFLHESGALDGVDDERVELATKSIDAHLRRETYPGWLTEHPLVSEALKIHRHLAEEFSPAVFSDRLNRRQGRLRRLCDEVLEMHHVRVAAETEGASHAARAAQYRSDLEVREREAEGLRGSNSSLEAELASLRAQYHDLRVEAEHQRVRADRALDEVVPDIQRGLGAIPDLVSSIRGLREESTSLAIASTAPILTRVEESVSRVESDLNEMHSLRHRIAALESSSSLRIGLAITWPVRNLKRLLGRK